MEPTTTDNPTPSPVPGPEALMKVLRAFGFKPRPRIVRLKNWLADALGVLLMVTVTTFAILVMTLTVIALTKAVL